MIGKTMNKDEKKILSMFAYARPMGSPTEQAFVDRFLTPLGFKRDAHQNLWVEVKETDGRSPRVLFSSHVDTVDRREGMKTLSYDGQILTLSNRDLANGMSCLGADDTAGVWLMTEMLKAGVPGLYVIHHGEEKGCVGSRAIATKAPEFLAGIEIALAFDRAGTKDVITHQMGMSTASTGFAWSLARQLGGNFKPSDEGVYTDTNEYSHIVAECSNLAVGYQGQHGTGETQDVPFLIDLRDKLLGVDWSALNVERDPNAYEGFFGGGNRWLDDEDFWRRPSGESDSDLTRMIEQYPEVAATIFEAFGANIDDLSDEIERQLGIVVGRKCA
jgi:hypothetical protein